MTGRFLVLMAMGLALGAPALAQPPLPPGHPPAVGPGQVPPGPGQPSAAELGPADGPLPPGHPPTGPAQAMQQIGQAQQQRSQEELQSPGDTLHRILRGETPELAQAAPSSALPAGTIQVTVVDGEGTPVQGATVDVGILGQGGARDRRALQTDAEGVALFAGLDTGSAQAYRVNAREAGATASSTPFQLPPDQGYQVRLTRLATTTDASVVYQLVSRTFLEIRDERVHVVQMAKLLNRQMVIYVLPEDGKLIRLPEGFMAFQSQPVMTDQRLEPTEEGFLLRGSLPPGYTDLVWAYDLPLDGTEMELEVLLPWRTFEIQVESDAPPGLRLDVTGMPEPETVESDTGRAMLVTARRYATDEPQPSVVRIKISGAPGPGPGRWLALGAAGILFLAGLLFVFTGGPGDRRYLTDARRQRRQELLRDAIELEQMFERSEVGPKFRGRRMEAIITELSALLQEEATAEAAARIIAKKSGGGAKGGPKPKGKAKGRGKRKQQA